MSTSLKPMLVSIIIPNYNNSKYIEGCISSAQSQAYSNIEIIVVDDCSTDNSLQICEKISKDDSRIIIHKNEIRMGVSVARNIGAQISSGQYITFLDSDDYYLDVNKILLEITLAMKPKIENDSNHNHVIYSLVNIVDSDCRIIRTTKALDKIQFEDILLRRIDIPRDFIMPRKLFMDIGGFSPSINLFEDWHFKLHLSKSCVFVCSEQVGSVYRQVAGGLSNRPFFIIIMALYKIFFMFTKRYSISHRFWLTILFSKAQVVNYLKNRK